MKLFFKKDTYSAHQKETSMHLAQRSSLLYILFTALWAATIFVLSVISGEQLPKVTWLMSPDKFAHAFVYAILAFGLYQIFKQQNISQPRLISAGIATAYGILMEVIQYTFFPGRYFEVADIIANITGIVITLLFLKLINH